MWTLERLFLVKVGLPDIAALSGQPVLISFAGGSTVGTKILYGEYKESDKADTIVLRLENNGVITLTQHGGKQNFARTVIYEEQARHCFAGIKVSIGSARRCICDFHPSEAKLLIDHSPKPVLESGVAAN